MPDLFTLASLAAILEDRRDGTDEDFGLGTSHM